MCPPAKVVYSSMAEYRKHFEDTYCNGPVYTFDGIPVRFRKLDFDHCMYESSKRDDNKDLFSKDRCERIDWIKATLENDKADLYQGWDKKKKRADKTRRVAVVYEEYVVVIKVRENLAGDYEGEFGTAYLADSSISKIRGMPRWSK